MKTSKIAWERNSFFGAFFSFLSETIYSNQSEVAIHQKNVEHVI